MLFLSFQIFFLLLIAGAIGVFCGWLLFAKPSKAKASDYDADGAAGDTGSVGSLSQFAGVPEERHRQVVGELEDELENARVLLDSREADVARLRGKLKKAVTELDRKVEQLRSERDLVEALRGDLADAQEVIDSGRPALEDSASQHLITPQPTSSHPVDLQSLITARSSEGSDDPTAVELTSAAVEAASAEVAAARSEMNRLVEEAEHAAFRLQLSERALDDARTRASDAERAVEDFRSELVRTRTESAEKISALELEASNSRLRADAATMELQELEQQLLDIQMANARLLEQTTSTIGAAKSHIQAARVSLTGQTPMASDRTREDLQQRDDELEISPVGLEALPGATPELINQLRELGVEQLADIASWNSGDLERFQAWMPEASIELATWPAEAHQLLMDRHLENVVD